VVAAPKPSPLLARLQEQIEKLEREAAFLRRVDATMRERLRAAVDEAERLKKMSETQATMLADVRRQLEARSLELELVRAELEAEKASRPKPPPEKPASEPPVRRRLDVD